MERASPKTSIYGKKIFFCQIRPFTCSRQNLTNMINMDHIQTYGSVLSIVELTTRLKQDKKKWRAVFHTCIKLLFPSTPVYECIYYISGRKWSTNHRVLKSHRSKTDVIYMQSWKLCALAVITTMALWQLMHLGTWWTMLQQYIMYVPKCMICHRAIVVTCFHDCINIYI